MKLSHLDMLEAIAAAGWAAPVAGVEAEGPGGVAAPAGQFDELRQHLVEEEPEPDALALAVLADQVHAVIPVAAADQRQAVSPEAQAVVQSAKAVVAGYGFMARAIARA